MTGDRFALYAASPHQREATTTTHRDRHDLDFSIELVRDVPLVTLYLAGEAALCDAAIPAPLSAHPDHRLVLNMWVTDDSTLSTGFGTGETTIGIAYLAAEVAGPTGQTVDGSVTYPGRYWLRHWCSNVSVRDYAARASGLTLEPANIRLMRDGERLTYLMEAGDGSRIEATTVIGARPQGSAASRSVYYASRDGRDGREIARYDIPAVADAYGLDLAQTSCRITGALPFIVHGGDQQVLAASFRRMTLAPYIARGPVT